MTNPIAEVPSHDVAKLVEELRTLAAKATEGPWFFHDFTSPAVNSAPSAADVLVSCTTPDHIAVASMAGGLFGRAGIEQAKHDAAFIAAANPAAVLTLLTALESLSRDLAEARAATEEERKIGDQWRSLALKFDRHRIAAMSLLKAVAAGSVTAEDCKNFVALPPPSDPARSVLPQKEAAR